MLLILIDSQVSLTYYPVEDRRHTGVPVNN